MSANIKDQYTASGRGYFSGHDGHSDHPHLFALKVKLMLTKAAWGKLINIFKPNHLHDEPHERLTDRRREAVRRSHRYESFAPVTQGNDVKWYVDGRDYFWAVSVALEEAREVIYIQNWWLSPELFLRRPPRGNLEWRLDRILKRKAEQGVKIYVSVYKEVTPMTANNSKHTKHALEKLCPHGHKGHGNIVVARHPDHDPFLHGADPTWFWAHHEKFVVIDHKLAFVGGLDLCFGRWDMHQHPLADVHPQNLADEIWPGQDFNDNRIMDFQHVEKWQENQLDKTIFGRMPWHDVALGIVGPAVMSVAEHFVGRWNYIKRDKYKRNPNRPWLQLSGVPDDILGVQHPAFPIGGYIRHPLYPDGNHILENRGPCEVQIVRSSADWSDGIKPKEQSIQTAYKSLIENAQHFIYIENQFFITATGNQQAPIHNQIGQSIVNAVVRAHNDQRKFRIIIVIPAIPGFPGNLRDDAALGTRAIIDYQFKSLNRGENSIFCQLRAKNIDPTQYIFVFNLRTYDRLHTTKGLRKREEESGIAYRDLQAANDADVLQPDRKKAKKGNAITLGGGVRVTGSATRRKERQNKFGQEMGIGETAGRDTVAEDAMNSGRRLQDEPWSDNDSQEKLNYFQEELYVHAKVMIVDDETLICGSSNINDRSQLGDHDSELAAVVTHPRTVSALRKQLWMEHLGLLRPQSLDGSDNPNAQPPGRPNAQDVHPLVEDPMSDQLWELWTAQATRNTDIYRQLFHTNPDDCIKTWPDYDEFCSKREKALTGHIWNAEDITAAQVKEELGAVRGHLVWMALDFLKDEVMAEPGLQFNAITQSIYT